MADRGEVSPSPETVRDRISSVPYRDVLDTPGITRAHDMQRLVSYGVGVAVALVVEMPRWRASVVLVIASILFLAALARLVTNREAPPYQLALTDLFSSGIAVAIATASLVLTIAVVTFIAIAIGATFKAPRRLAITASIVTGAPAIIIAVLIRNGDGGGGSDYLGAMVLIILSLALAVFILGFFTIQARQLRQQLVHREKQLNAVLEVTPVVLASVARDHTLTILAGGLTDWQELSGRQIDETSPIASLTAATGAGERATRDITIGEKVYSVTCDPGADGNALLTAYDVTEQTHARLRLEEVVRSKDQFIAAVSHELRTPLASVLGFSEIVQERMNASDSLQPMMTEVTDQSAEMAAIIDDLLVAARASFDSVPLAPRQIGLDDETSAVIDAIGSRLSVSPDCHLETATAFADPIRVRQIVRNLLTNADRYGGDQVEVATTASTGWATLEVRDSGKPLPQELRERIFQPYESSGPVRGQPAAIGLGLTVSRTLAELMGGTIRYDHNGEWSIFELRLPADASCPLPPNLPTPAPYAASAVLT